MNLVREKLERAKRADYSENPDFQRQIMEIADREALVEWARKDEEPVVVMALPETKRRYSFLRAVMP